jgi:hypothetical protein
MLLNEYYVYKIKKIKIQIKMLLNEYYVYKFFEVITVIDL